MPNVVTVIVRKPKKTVTDRSCSKKKMLQQEIRTWSLWFAGISHGNLWQVGAFVRKSILVPYSCLHRASVVPKTLFI